MRKKRLIWVIFFLFILVMLAIGMTIPAFAQTEAEQVANPIKAFFDWIGSFVSANMDASDLPQEKIDQIKDTSDAGVTVAERTIDLWLGFHELIINAIFAGSPIEFDKGIAIMISFVVGSALVLMLLWKFVKHAWKWILVSLGFIAFILILGIEAPKI